MKITLENMNLKKKKEIGSQFPKSLMITVLFNRREHLRNANKDGNITLKTNIKGLLYEKALKKTKI